MIQFRLYLTRARVLHSDLLVPCESLAQALAYGNEYAGLEGAVWRSKKYNGRKVYRATTSYGDVLQIVCHKGELE